MTVLVDEARWAWRGRLWAHLVSDRSLDELHAFAKRLGLRRMAFQGDHYDVPEELREPAIAAGAEPVSSRVLVRRLRAAGLRLPPSARPASWQAEAPRRGHDAIVAGWPAELGRFPRPLEADHWWQIEATVYRRPGEVALVLHGGPDAGLRWDDPNEPLRFGVRVLEHAETTTVELHRSAGG